jgi:RNA polymerase sigma factor (sigma-70 family)
MDTDDLVQETFVGVLGRLDDFRPKHDEALQAYLRVSLVNRLRDEIRKLPRKPTLVVDREDLVAREPSPFEELLGVELHTKYREALGRLRPEDRDLLEAKLDRDLDYAEPPR